MEKKSEGKKTDILNEIVKLRKNKMLHSTVFNELTIIISRYFPKYEPIVEIQGLAGGRNDLIAFKYNTRKILFEVFAQLVKFQET